MWTIAQLQPSENSCLHLADKMPSHVCPQYQSFLITAVNLTGSLPLQTRVTFCGIFILFMFFYFCEISRKWKFCIKPADFATFRDLHRAMFCYIIGLARTVCCTWGQEYNVWPRSLTFMVWTLTAGLQSVLKCGFAVYSCFLICY